MAESGRLFLKNGGRWDWLEMDSKNWWELGGWPQKKQVGLMLRPLPHTSSVFIGLH